MFAKHISEKGLISKYPKYKNKTNKQTTSTYVLFTRDIQKKSDTETLRIKSFLKNQ